MRRIRVALVVVAAVVGVVAPSVAGSAEAPQPAAVQADAERTMLWGAYTRPVSGQSERQAVEALETVAGRRLGLSRVFQLWDETFPTAYETWLRDTGHTLILSVRAKTGAGTLVPFRTIGSAQPGSAAYQRMVTWAQQIKAFGAPVYVTFNHEPEAADSVGNGEAPDFIAAWRNWVSVFRDQGVTNARFMWIMTEHAFQVSSADRRYAAKWYPGDAWVDDFGADAYNDYTCRGTSSSPWKTLAEDIEGFRRFGLQHPDKGMWLPEWASAPDPANSGRRPAWIDEARELFKLPAYAQFRGISYFNSFRPGTPCVWVLTQDGAAARWAAMGADPFYGGTAPPPPPGDEVQLVVAAPAASGDVVLRDRLVAAGYSVTVVDDNAFTAAGASGADAVLISSSADDRALGPIVRTLAVPIVSWKPWLFDDLGLAPATSTGYGLGRGSTVTIADATSPLAAGLTGTVAITTQVDNVGWGVPPASAQVAARTAEGNAALYSARTGQTLSTGAAAPSCRAALPFHTKSALSFTAAGGRLFDAAVSWAVSC